MHHEVRRVPVPIPGDARLASLVASDDGAWMNNCFGVFGIIHRGRHTEDVDGSAGIQYFPDHHSAHHGGSPVLDDHVADDLSTTLKFRSGHNPHGPADLSTQCKVP